MRNIFCKIFLCVVIFCLSSFAKNVIFSGQFIDTVLVTEEAKGPHLSITPVESCKVIIFAGCNEGTKDQYFATTDKNGIFSAELNLDENCTDNMVVTANAVIGSDTVANIYIIFRADTLLDTLRSDLSICPKSKNDTVDFHGYTFGIHTITPDLVCSGDSLMAHCTIESTTDNNDTLHFLSDCRIKTQLVTSSGDTVSSNSFICGSRVLHLEKDIFTMHNINIPIPEGLQNSHPDFAKDRKLTLVIRFNIDSNIFDTVSFRVIDKSIPVQPVTSTNSQNITKLQTSAVKLSSRSSMVQVYLSESGTYSIDLFSIDGRLLQQIVRNERLNEGEHVFDIKGIRAGASKAVIARVKNSNRVLTSLINLL